MGTQHAKKRTLTPQKAAQLKAAQAHRQSLTEGFPDVDAMLEDKGLGPVAGVDEAGRGACCGPITIAACILPVGELPELAMLTDSKKLTPKRRDLLFEVIKNVAVAYSVVNISASEIDDIGIQEANVSGMRRAVARLAKKPGYVLTDAVHVPGLAQPHLPMVKGDLLSRSISAASVLAKVSRDRQMIEMGELYPEYGLGGHKGYGTAKHMAAVSLHGGTPEHRYTYSNVATAHAAWQENNPHEEGRSGL